VCLTSGLGDARKELRIKSFLREWGEDGPVVHALTLAQSNLRRASTADVLAYFQNTWDLTDTLFSALRDDSVFYAIPDKLRRPLIFYFAHPAAVYANKMHLAGLMDTIDPFLQKLFETGVDEMSWDDMDELQDCDFPWPDVAVAQAFRLKCKAAVEAVIKGMKPPCEEEVTMRSPLWALFMGFEHEKIHLETSSVLFRQLPVSSVVRPLNWKYAGTLAASPDAAPANELVSVAPGVAVLGKPVDFPSFGWDNEYGQRKVDVPAFKASKFLATNAEFLPFVLAGGYKQKQYWVSPAGDDEGWRWVTYRNATHPSFWVAPAALTEYHGGLPDRPYQKDDGSAAAGTGSEFMLRAEFDILPMPWDWPVEVNYHEARAFLNWKGANDGKVYRMPTEAEYHMCRAEPSGFDPVTLAPATATDDAVVASDPMMGPAPKGNVNMTYGSSCPVNEFPPSASGFYDVHGNVWEWVEDHFAPLPEFEIHFLYDDFSTPCFDGWHTGIMGGSWISSGDLASNYARYHFRRHFFQHLGFRYVQVEEPEAFPGAATVTNMWEGVGPLSEAITNAYGARDDSLLTAGGVAGILKSGLQYVNALADRCLSAYTASGPSIPASSAKVLHLGCGVGGVAFALSKHFGRVVGVDASSTFVRHARIMQHHGQEEYERVREGILTETTLATVDPAANRGNVAFYVSDPAAVAPEVLGMGPFDLVLVDDVLTHTVQPLFVLKGLAALTTAGSVLVVASDNHWDPATTPRNSWLGGFKMNGEDMSTVHMLRHNLKKHFNFLDSEDVAKVTQQHARRYELSILETTAWSRL